MKKEAIIYISVLFLALVSCETNIKKESHLNQKTFTDDLGRTVSINYPPQRVIGLAPNLTEILYAICPDSQIVGRTQNCNYPAKCIEKPVINNFPIDYEKLLQINPDVIFTFEGITPLKDIHRMEELGFKVYHIFPTTLSELINSFETLGKITGDSTKGIELKVNLLTQIEDLKNELETRKTVLALASNSPIYTYGQNTLFSEKIFIAGGMNAMQEELQKPYPEVNSEYILKLNPDVILGGTFSELDSSFFNIYPELKMTKAYQKKNIFPVDADLMTRPSPRVIESIKELKAIIEQSN